jgi:hypothetical protein
VVVARGDGAVTWASWVSIGAGSVVRIAAPQAPACSREDVAAARAQGDAVRAGGVRCARWIAVTASRDEPDALRIATCAGSSCDALAEWRAPPAAAWVEPPSQKRDEAHGRWPAWATWAIAGVAVAGTAVAAILVSAAAKSPPDETRFVNGGVQVR